MRPKFLTSDGAFCELAPPPVCQAVLTFNNLMAFPKEEISQQMINTLARGCSMCVSKLMAKFCLWYRHISAMQCAIF
jgi:hypothetical protein